MLIMSNVKICVLHGGVKDCEHQECNSAPRCEGISVKVIFLGRWASLLLCVLWSPGEQMPSECLLFIIRQKAGNFFEPN